MTWLPFELHPEVPPEGIPRDSYFPAARRAQIEAHMQALAEDAGLTMRSRDRLINTRRALGAAEFAREQGKFEAMHEALFEAHWHQTAHLEEIDDLVRVGESVGLDGAELRRALEEGRYEPVIDRWRQEAEQVGINAIPAHIFSPDPTRWSGGDPDRGGRFLVVGAHPYEIFKQVVDRLQSGAG